MWFYMRVMIAPTKSCWCGQVEAKFRVCEGMKVLEDGRQSPGWNQYQKTL